MGEDAEMTAGYNMRRWIVERLLSTPYFFNPLNSHAFDPSTHLPIYASTFLPRATLSRTYLLWRWILGMLACLSDPEKRKVETSS